MNNIYDRRKITSLLLKNSHKIITRYILQTLYTSNLITCVIIKREYSIYLFSRCCRCMKFFCVPVAIPIPVSFRPLALVGVLLGQQSLHTFPKFNHANLVLVRNLQPCILHLFAAVLYVCFQFMTMMLFPHPYIFRT